MREVAFLARLYFQAATSNLLKGKSSLPSRSASLTLSPPRHSRREADRSRKDTADGLQHDEKDEKQLRNDEKQPRNNEARESTGEKWSLYNAEKDRERVDERGSEFLSADETPRRAGSMSGTNEKYFLVRSKKSRRIVASGKPPQWEFGIAAKVLTGECEVISVSINAGRMDAIALSAAAVIGAGSPAKRRPSLVGLHERERRVGVEEGDDEAEKAELRRPIPVTFGEHSSQGSRPSMEDAHAVFLNTFEGEMTRTSCSFFGVYDGHGGREAAVYLRDYLHLQIRNSQHFRRDIKAALQEAFLWVSEREDRHACVCLFFTLDAAELVLFVSGTVFLPLWRFHLPCLLKIRFCPFFFIRCILLCLFDFSFFFPSLPSSVEPMNTPSVGQTDRALLDNARRERYESGAVAVTVIIRHRTAFISNVGDSRAVLSRGRRSLELSNDHTLELQRERDRIVNSGGKVIGGRLNGILAVSRAFGDLHHIRPDKDKDKDSSGEGTSQSWEKARKMLGLSVEPRIVEEELHKDDRVSFNQRKELVCRMLII